MGDWGESVSGRQAVRFGASILALCLAAFLGALASGGIDLSSAEKASPQAKASAKAKRGPRGPRGPRGLTGPRGPKGVVGAVTYRTDLSFVTIAAGATGYASVACESNEKAVGGGVDLPGGGGDAEVVSGYPYQGGMGWAVSLYNPTGNVVSALQVVTYAICAEI